MTANVPVLVARAALVVAALACAVWLNQGHFAVGLDFQGGAMVMLVPEGDPQHVMMQALAARPEATVRLVGNRVEVEIEGGDEADVLAVVTRVGHDARQDFHSVITSTSVPSLGKQLAGGVAIAAALLWLGVLARAHTAGLALAGTFAIAWTITLVDILARGGTLTMPVQIAGMLLGLAAAPAARVGDGEPLARIRAAWPAALALAVVLVASLIAAGVDTPHDGTVKLWAIHALRSARHPLFAVAPIAAACAIASTRTRRS